ncbi:MAG TPA: hypothetical protein VNO34_04085 [Actinomycetota bacterium]|nr:hypothetical protein [Actinomycetota bacterium]
MADRVVVRVPASTAHLALVRATATALACLVDFPYDRITDLQIAIDEVCSRILATSETAPTQLEVTFLCDPDTLRLEVRGDRPLRQGASFLTDWSRTILEAVAEGVEVQSPDGIAVVSLAVSRG